MGRETRSPRNGEPGTLTDWRRRALAAAGFDDALGARLAHEPQLDLHTLLELVDAGCPPRLAARILQPLDADWGVS